MKETQHFLQQDLLSYTREQIATTIETLRAVLRFHNHHYYNDTPMIADGEYDTLFTSLIERERAHPDLITENSPTQHIGAPPLDGFEKRSHKVALLSLQNTYNAEDIKRWHEFNERQLEKHSIKAWSYSVEAKLDGSSVEIIYEYGKLTGGVTRGDGQVGEDISQHVALIQNLPHVVSAWEHIKSVHLRGEVVMSQTAFEKTNQFQTEQGLSPFANPRNAAAGTLRQLDTMLTQKRGLSCFVYDLLYTTDRDLFPDSDIELLDYFSVCSIPVFDRYKHVSTLEELIALCEDDLIKAQTQQGSIGCDGLVIKVNENHFRELLGSTEHHPRRAMAFKYPAQEKAAHISAIELQVGRTGVITPLALLEPIVLGGVTVSKATLHNFDFIKNRDIRKGDWVRIKRSGEVIPYVIGPIIKRRDDHVVPFAVPTHCPICGSNLSNDGEEVALYCKNTDCPGKIIAQLQHFVSKQCMNIQGLGDALIEQLVAVGLVKNIPDLYLLVDEKNRTNNKHTLSALPGLGEKKIVSIFDEIHTSKKNPLWRLIHGLGIRGIGKKGAQLIQKFIEEQGVNRESITLERLQEIVTQEKLEDIFGIGPIVAADIVDYVHGMYGADQIKKMITLGLFGKEQRVRSSDSGTGVLDGVQIVLTGTMEYSRDHIAEMIEENGGVVTSTISGNTTYLVFGEKAGSKLKKAKDKGVETLSSQEFFDRFPAVKDGLETGKNNKERGKNKLSDVPTQNGLFG